MAVANKSCTVLTVWDKCCEGRSSQPCAHWAAHTLFVVMHACQLATAHTLQRDQHPLASVMTPALRHACCRAWL